MSHRFFEKLGVFISIFGRVLLFISLIGAGFYVSLLDVEIEKKLFELLGPVFLILLFIHEKIWKPIKLARINSAVPWYLICWQYDVSKSKPSAFANNKLKTFLGLGLLALLSLASSAYDDVTGYHVSISRFLMLKCFLAAVLMRILYKLIINLSRTSIREK